MKRATLAFVIVLGASNSMAQSLSSFQTVTGLTALNSSLSGNSLTVTAGANPSFVMNSLTYNITDVFGVWLLDENDDLSASGAGQNGFNYHNSYSGTGGIAGWKTNPNSGFVNDTKVFTFASKSGLHEDMGYHVRVAETLPGGANTLYIRNAPVPEPASLTALALGGLAMLRSRRVKK